MVTGPTVLQAALQKKTARKRKSQGSTESVPEPTESLDVSLSRKLICNLTLVLSLIKHYEMVEVLFL